MNARLKLKYRPKGRTPEPDRAKGNQWKGNSRRGARTATDHHGTKGNKGTTHPTGFSGRTLGRMSRRYSGAK